MDYILEMLSKPFTELELGQQVLMISILACCVALVSYSVVLAARRTTQRRHARRALVKRIEVRWVDHAGQKQSAEGYCLNVSEGGLQMELSEPIKVSTELTFRVLDTKLSGTATVRHCTEKHSRYFVGVEFTGGQGTDRPA